MLGLSHPGAARARRAAGRDRAARAGARVLLRQRLDRRRGRGEDGLPALAAARASRSGPSSSACATPTTATRSARSRSAASTSSTRRSAGCCSRPTTPSRATPPTCARLLEAHGERVAAVVVEPLVQGAAGMIVHPEGYLRAVRELCDEFGVLLICDEVAVGFGRTGTMFACQQEDVAPDLMCVAKGITGGYLPLAATLTTEAVYDAFLGEHEELQDVLPRPHLHGQPARLRGGARHARRVRVRAHARAARAEDRAARRAARRARRAAADGRRGPPPRLHDRDRARRRSRSTRAWATRSRWPRAGAARSCARSATSSC